MRLLILTIFSFSLISFQTKKQNRTEIEAKKLVDSIYIELMNGSGFANVAKLFSEDPGSAKKGGKYKDIKRGTFIPEFESVVFSLELNEISKPFETHYGYHIAQLLGKQGETISVRHILITFQE